MTVNGYCIRHNQHFDHQAHPLGCPCCFRVKPHRDAESAICELKAQLDRLYPKRWADAYDLSDQNPVDAIAHKCDQLRQMITALIGRCDWPEIETEDEDGRPLNVPPVAISHNQERLGP